MQSHHLVCYIMNNAQREFTPLQYSNKPNKRKSGTFRGIFPSINRFQAKESQITDQNTSL